LSGLAFGEQLMSTDQKYQKKIVSQKAAILNKCFINSPAAAKARVYYQAQLIAG
jgi:hypothetical protein